MAVIEVIPDEIRYWYATRTKVGQVVDIAVSAVSGKTAAPGELRTITKDEVSLCYVFVRQGSRRTSVATDPACAGLDNEVDSRSATADIDFLQRYLQLLYIYRSRREATVEYTWASIPEGLITNLSCYT